MWDRKIMLKKSQEKIGDRASLKKELLKNRRDVRSKVLKNHKGVRP
jgi:hypothetical protein